MKMITYYQVMSYHGIFTYLKPNVPIIKSHGANLSVSGLKINNVLEGDLMYYQKLDDDTVQVMDIKQRAEHRISGVLQITCAKRFGLTKRGVPVYNFVPLSWRYPNFMVASNIRAKQDYPKNVYMVVEFNEWTIDQKYPSGRCINVLGAVDNMDAQEKAILFKNGIYTKGYPKSLSLPVPSPVSDSNLNLSFTDKSIIAIDPEGSKDLDDAFHIDDDHIYVHIADVDATFNRDHIIESDIAKRMTSIYGQLRVYNMLPSEFSDNYISLNTSSPKAAITVVLDKQLNGQFVHQSCIKVTKCLTYDRAQTILDGPANNSIINVTMRKLSELTGQTDTHKMIESIMVATNVYIGQVLSERGVPFLIRVMPRLSGSVVSEVLPYLKYRGAKGAKYTVHNADICTDHGALGVSNYVHFTSPIRRYADLITQRIIKGQAYTEEQLNDIALRLNEYNINVKRYYRDVTIMKLSYKIPAGESYNTTGFIVDYNDETHYVFVYLPDYDVEYKYPLFNNNIQSITVEKSTDNLTVTNMHLNKAYTIPLFKSVDITLSVNPKAIRLNQRVIMHISGLSELFF